MSEARDETIRKQQAIRGAGTQSRETFPIRGFGHSPNPWLPPFGVPTRRDDLPSECPFGAERGMERTALCRTFLQGSLSALR